MNHNVSSDDTTAIIKAPPPSRISWSAIFAGVLITLVLQLLFTLLGAGIGAATIQPLHQGAPGKGMGIGSALWLLVTALISTYFGASAAGRISASPNILVRRLHGLLTWGATTIIGFVLLATTLGSVLWGAGSMLNGASTAASVSSSASPAQLPNAAGYANNSIEFNNRLTPTGRDNESLRTENQTRENLRAENEIRARQAADVAAKRLALAALWTLFVLVCSAWVAMFAGVRSKPWTPWGPEAARQQFAT